MIQQTPFILGSKTCLGSAKDLLDLMDLVYGIFDKLGLKYARAVTPRVDESSHMGVLWTVSP